MIYSCMGNGNGKCILVNEKGVDEICRVMNVIGDFIGCGYFKIAE